MNIKDRGVVFIIMRPDKTVLMQLRDNNSQYYKNTWCFPGGGCDDNEKYIDATVREIKEEYELVVAKNNCYLLMTKIYWWTFYIGTIFAVRHVFVCSVDYNQAPVLHEGADMKWMNIDEIKKLKLGFQQSNIVRKLEEYIK